MFRTSEVQHRVAYLSGCSPGLMSHGLWVRAPCAMLYGYRLHPHISWYRCCIGIGSGRDGWPRNLCPVIHNVSFVLLYTVQLLHQHFHGTLQVRRASMGWPSSAVAGTALWAMGCGLDPCRQHFMTWGYICTLPSTAKLCSYVGTITSIVDAEQNQSQHALGQTFMSFC